MTAPWFGLLAVLAVLALAGLAAFAIRRTPQEQADEDAEQMEALRRWCENEEHA